MLPRYGLRAKGFKCIEAAVAKAENEKAHQSAMEIIAKEMRFLDVVLNVQCPNGVEVKATARLDTGANTDARRNSQQVSSKTRCVGALPVGISSRCAGVTRTNQLECWKCR